MSNPRKCGYVRQRRVPYGRTEWANDKAPFRSLRQAMSERFGCRPKGQTSVPCQSDWGNQASGYTVLHTGGFLSLQDAAAWAGVSQRTLRRWIGQGLPRYQSGPRAKVLVRPEDITAFLTRKQVPVMDLNRLVEEVLQTIK